MSPSRLWAAVLGVVVLATARGGLCSPASAPPSILSQQVTEPVFGSRVYVAEAGRSHPFTVVLVHGLGEDGARVWDSLVPVLAEKYHVVTFDLPGFGRSSKPDAVYSPSAYADFVKWAVDRFVPGRFALAGHSLGGAVAIRYAAKYPDRLDRLVLADVAGVLHRVALTREMLSTDLASRAPSGTEGPLRALDKLVRSTLTRIPSLSLDIGTVYEAPYLREKVLGSDPARVAALALSEDDLTEAVYGIQVPTLVLWGTKDRVASLRTASALAQSLPDARLRLFEDCCHEPMREKPAAFNAAVMDWLSRKDTPRKPRGLPDPLSSRVGRCDREQGAFFTGDYQRIEVNDCRDVTISAATARRVEIANSSVLIQDSRIEGGEVGLLVRDSTVEITGVRIDAVDAIRASDSRLDLAGVQLFGSKAAVSTQDHSKVLFSISRARSPHTRGFLHGAWELTPEAPL